MTFTGRSLHEKLTDIQQASITELIAGKRQGNVISSLMSNFDIAREALETSMNSEGSAMAEHATIYDAQIFLLKFFTSQIKPITGCLGRTFTSIYGRWILKRIG